MVTATLKLAVVVTAVVVVTVEMEVVMALELDRPPAMTLLGGMQVEGVAATVVARVEA